MVNKLLLSPESTAQVIIMEEVTKLNQYFKSVVDMIPPSAYLGKNDFFQHKKSDKKLSNSAKKALTKKRKFDPETMKTTSEIIQKQHEIDTKKQKLSESSVNPNSAKTLDQLQQCLKDKIAEQLAKRSSSKRTPEQQLIVTQRRRGERQRKKAKQQKIMQKAKQDRKAQLKQLKASNKQNESAAKKSEAENENPEAVSAEGGGDSSNKAADKKVLFSKIDFGNELEVELGEKKARVVPKARKIKNLISQLEHKDKKLKELKEADPEQAARIEEEDAWAKAMDKSEGTKIKDDPKLLKKSIKRREALKQRSRNKWAERTAKVTEKMEKRQKIRKQNIANRKSGTKVVKKGGSKTKGKKMK